MRRLNAGARDPDQANSPKSATMESVKSLQIKKNPTFRSSNSNSFSKSTKRPSSKSIILIVSAVVITSAMLLYLLFGSRSLKTERKFRIIIDGGSTGTRIHVFEYQVEGGIPIFDFSPRRLASMRVSPGLSSYADYPHNAGESLVELLEFARERVPREFRGDTEIRLMATAGLRLLDVKVQESILESCRGVLKSSGFKFRSDWALVITGSEEGLYAWVVANYALGSLGGDPQQTSGIIELGGASMQVTFVSSKMLPVEFSRSLKYGNVTYNLYSRSLLQFGQNVAFNSVRELLVSSSLNLANGARSKEHIMDPCTIQGYDHEVKAQNSSSSPSVNNHALILEAQGNFLECKKAALMLLERRKEECFSQHCYSGSTLLPKLDGKFLATENFFHTSKFFGLAPKVRLSNLMEAGQNFCESKWSSVREKHPSIHGEDLMHYCFSSAYIVALLHDYIGIPLDDQSITYTNRVEKIPLDWSLGAFIIQITESTNESYSDWIQSSISKDYTYLFLLLVATSIILFVGWSFWKWQKPYLKTIYDLEKGRYIITRISRR